jgi:hypothetical protein
VRGKKREGNEEEIREGRGRTKTGSADHLVVVDAVVVVAAVEVGHIARHGAAQDTVLGLLHLLLVEVVGVAGVVSPLNAVRHSRKSSS